MSVSSGQLRKPLAERAAPKGTFENDFKAIPRSVDVVIVEPLGVADAVRSSGQAASRCSSDIDNMVLVPAPCQARIAARRLEMPKLRGWCVL